MTIEKPKYETDIQRSLNYRFNYNYHIYNAFIYGWEADYFIINKSNYAVEFEIKLSKSDYLADFNKIDKHKILADANETWKPNKFYYCCPAGLIKDIDIPKYAGLIYYKPENNGVEIVKPAPFLHKERNRLTHKLCEKYYYLWIKEVKKQKLI